MINNITILIMISNIYFRKSRIRLLMRALASKKNPK
jgi:hypothetical protein